MKADEPESTIWRIIHRGALRRIPRGGGLTNFRVKNNRHTNHPPLFPPRGALRGLAPRGAFRDAEEGCGGIGH
ncbi:MAG: hypothetical protein OXU77_13520, partial [Gammaproteobacteria bacterium]|nr:hypothetical protein [Gammaproteobacteria bacterium]